MGGGPGCPPRRRPLGNAGLCSPTPVFLRTPRNPGPRLPGCTFHGPPCPLCPAWPACHPLRLAAMAPGSPPWSPRDSCRLATRTCVTLSRGSCAVGEAVGMDFTLGKSSSDAHGPAHTGLWATRLSAGACPDHPRRALGWSGLPPEAHLTLHSLSLAASSTFL